MWVAVGANGVNGLVNWLLIFGHWGLPELGVAGAGIATAITEAAMFSLLLGLVRAGHLARGAWTPWSRASFAPRGILRIVAIGLPVAVQIGLEVWAFQIVTLWAGRLGPTELAANTIVLNLVSVSFMIPLGISIGTATRVGNLLGAKKPEEAQHAAWVAFAMGASVMAMSAVFLLVGRGFLPAMYTSDEAVRALATKVLPIGAAFQLFDGLQVVGSGILRGMGRTLPGAVINLFGYYALALPFAAWLGLLEGWRLQGLWWGLSLGLAVVALLLLLWVARRGPRTVTERLVG
jgi:MATE family multidrug resistance protein